MSKSDNASHKSNHWSQLNKDFQDNLKRDTFNDAINILLNLRKEMFDYIHSLKEESPDYDYSKQPFINHPGYENKTIAYSIYHMFRIEDIVSNILISRKENDIFIDKGYQSKLRSPIITTGNELVKEEIRLFSEKLNISELYNYINEVYESSNQMLMNLRYDDLKQRFNDEDKQRIIDAKVVSDNEDAFWLINYWCSKDVMGLLRMPFSRHLIMHTEACKRIKEGIVRDKLSSVKKVRRNTDPVA